MKLLDAHCHLQDAEIFDKTPQLIATAIDNGILHFAVNGTSEKDWHLVKEMGEQYPSVIPCFGIHPWRITDRSPNWFNTLKEFCESTPSSTVGEIGLDKSPLADGIDYGDQVEVFRKQLELAKELNKPVSVHCLDAFDDLLDMMKSIGPFPAGVILHSYAGSADLVPAFSQLNCYFSFSGWLMYIQPELAKLVVKAVSLDRILIETDSPHGVPKLSSQPLLLVEGGQFYPIEGEPLPSLNHPANLTSVLSYVASLLDMEKEEVAKIIYRNAINLFSYEGSKLLEP